MKWSPHLNTVFYRSVWDHTLTVALFFVQECQHACLTRLLCPLPSPPLSGFRQRRRELLWESSSPLETCPHLVESVPCEDPACYLWQVQHEERCIPTKSPCGPGTAVQNVTCVSAEGNVPHLHHKFVFIQSLNTERVFLYFNFTFFQLLKPKECFWHFGKSYSFYPKTQTFVHIYN